MKKIFLVLAVVVAAAFGAKALTYEQAFEAVKAMPEMQGVDGTVISGNNDFASIGVTDAQLIVWAGETRDNTATYGNKIYSIIGELPVSEMVQSRMAGSSIMAIFAKPVSADTNRIIILSDSAGAGFTGAIIGYINDYNLEALRQAIIIPRETGGMAIYLKTMNF